MSTDQVCYTLIGLPSDTKTKTEQQLKDDLQNNNIDVKREALKAVIRLIVNGERFPNILMIVIRFVMPSKDHFIKKLLLLFWEVVPKYGADGKRLQEMILVCDAYRRDLLHPNEFIRGSTLRFLCKLKDPELLEPLMPAIQQCLEHRHAYVRRNAVLAIFTIYKNFEYLIPDAPQKVLQFLEQEQDASCKRNAFMMLLHASQSLALDYLTERLDQVQNFNDILQLIIVELIYKVCHSKPTERSRFIRCIYSLLQSSSPAVRYEAASTLTTLSSAPSAVKAAASCYISLILKESDNNIKLIVLSRLTELRHYHESVLQGLVMDIVPILSSSDLEIRQKTLQLTVDLVTSRTAEDLTKLYKKELIRACSTTVGSSTSSSSGGKAQNETTDDDTYRYDLVRTMYEISIRYIDSASTSIPAICDILTYEQASDSKAAIEACRFLREVMQQFPHKRADVLEKLMQVFPNILGENVLRNVLWLFGEYCTSLEEITTSVTLIRQLIGDISLVKEEQRRLAEEDADTDGRAGIGDEAHHTSALLSSDGGLGFCAPRVTADGTYATQSALTSVNISSDRKAKKVLKRPIIQATLFEAHYMPGVVLAVCLVKLFHRYTVLVSTADTESDHDTEAQHMLEESLGVEVKSKKTSWKARENSFGAECMLIISSMLHLAHSGLLPHHVNSDHLDRMWICLKIIADRRPEVLEAFNQCSHDCLVEMLAYQENERKSAAKLRNKGIELHHQQKESQMNRADAPIKFSLLLGGNSDLGDDLVDRFDLTLSQALGAASGGSKAADDAYTTSKLIKVRQLTGFSDPIYAEAYVNINQFDIVLDVLIVNQTRDTLQNLILELSTLGDLRLVEKPSPLTIAPGDFANVKASIKVSSTENGIIFGNISYDIRGSAGETTCIVLNDIHIDIMEYIIPSVCSTEKFRQMWSEFEWENKVAVNTQIDDLVCYLSRITADTNMRCLTPLEAMFGECDYLCVNLYARTIFGEHILANLCIEKAGPDQPVTGHVRIRAKTQGMAVTMGEKVSASHKNRSNDGVSDGDGPHRAGRHGNSKEPKTSTSSGDEQGEREPEAEVEEAVIRTHSPTRPPVSAVNC